MYLGDGVYATFNGYEIALDLRAQAPVVPITRIVLEPPVMRALIEFHAACTTPAKDEPNGGV